MVADIIKNASKYFGLGENFKTALEHLSSSDYLDVLPGRYEITEGIFALVQQYETLPEKDCKWEAHKKFIDIQFVARGTEQLGYAYAGSLDVVKEYDENGDYMLLAGQGGMLCMDAGMFAIFMPDDAHMPGIAHGCPKPVKKVIVKVAV